MLKGPCVNNAGTAVGLCSSGKYQDCWTLKSHLSEYLFASTSDNVMRISEIFHLQKVNPNGSVTAKHFSGQEQRKSATYNLSSLWLNRLVFIVGSGSDLQLMTRVSTFFVALK